MDTPASGRRFSAAAVRELAERHGLLLLILGLGLAARLYELTSVPPGFNQDEASTGYDAWAILHHGIDRNGFHLPVLLVSWGSGQNALPSYLAMPFLAVFGASAAAVRAVN